jgi:signal transduction histidine kinase
VALLALQAAVVFAVAARAAPGIELAGGRLTLATLGALGLALILLVGAATAVVQYRLVVATVRCLEHEVSNLAAANAELEAFAGAVAHDLRTPLWTVDLYRQELLGDYAERLDAQGRDWLHRIGATTGAMLRLVDDLLHFSRAECGQLRREPVDLSRLARGVGADLRRLEPGRRVRLDVDADIVAEGDPQLLRVVLENLLTNAWKFTAGRPAARIAFGVRREPGGPGGAPGRNGKSGEPVYFVRDDGAGFDPARAHLLFRPGQRLHDGDAFPGTGIGLCTVRRIIARHGGRLWAEGAVGRGATFYFTLPAPCGSSMYPAPRTLVK